MYILGWTRAHGAPELTKSDLMFPYPSSVRETHRNHLQRDAMT